MHRIYPHLPKPRLLVAVLLVIFSLLLAACGSKGDSGQKIAGNSLTVFSALPLSGPLGSMAASMVKAEKLALKQGRGKAGKFTINYISLNDADRAGLTRELVAQDARKVTREGKTIAYVGGLTSSAASVALPILNQDDVLFVSPTSSAVGLTKVYPGARPGEPTSYYVSGKRNFVRIAPSDDVVANAAASWTSKLKAKRVILVNDRSAYGRGLAEQFAARAKSQHLDIIAKLSLPSAGARVPSLASSIVTHKPDAVFFGGSGAIAAASLLKAVHAAQPGIKLLTSTDQDGLFNKAFNSALGKAASSTYLVSSILDPRQLPKAGKTFIRQYKTTFKQNPDRYAVYAYTVMNLVRDAIKKAGANANDRLKVTEQMLKTKNYKSPLGTFSIDENGDSSLRQVAGYRVRNGVPVFVQSLKG